MPSPNKEAASFFISSDKFKPEPRIGFERGEEKKADSAGFYIGLDN